MSKGDNNMEFTAEVNRLLQILTHSIYSNKEVFLRELISNASDACDKLRYISISQSDVAIDDLKIKITVDSNKKTISISDNGIGMTRDEMIENLGFLNEPEYTVIDGLLINCINIIDKINTFELDSSEPIG